MSQSKTLEDDKNMQGNLEFKLGSDKEARNRRWHRYPAAQTSQVLSTNTDYTYAGAQTKNM